MAGKRHCAQKRTAQVDGDHTVKGFGRFRQQRFNLLDGGVVDQNVHTSHVGNGVSKQTLHLRRVADIARQSDGGNAFVSQTACGLFASGRVNVGDDDACADFAHRFGSGEPDAPRCAGDERHFAR